MTNAVVAFPLLLMFSAAAPPRGIEVRTEGLRSERGALHICMTREQVHFADCGRDPRAIKHSMAAGRQIVRLEQVPPGIYALSVMHDENRNGKLDTLLGIPREGFGFSRNPAIRFGPPRFDQVRMEVGAGITSVRVRMQYLLWSMWIRHRLLPRI